MAPEDQAPDYVAKRKRCWACMVREVESRNAAEANKGRQAPGTYWAVERRNGHGG
jgi:hypothetical protein